MEFIGSTVGDIKKKNLPLALGYCTLSKAIKIPM